MPGVTIKHKPPLLIPSRYPTTTNKEKNEIAPKTFETTKIICALTCQNFFTLFYIVFKLSMCEKENSDKIIHNKTLAII